MILNLDIILLTLVLLCGIISLCVTDLMAASIIFGAYSFLMCLVWAALGAVDVAFTEAAVGAGIGTVIFISTIYNMKRDTQTKKNGLISKIIGSFIVVVVGVLLLIGVSDYPELGDPHSPANNHVAAYYVEHAMDDTKVPNIVTAVLADYRGYDTMYETAVVFVACIGIYGILRQRKKKNEDKSSQAAKITAIPPYDPSNSFIIKIASQLMVPFMQLFALYVVAHGHHSPGGGFQGGVILGASLILLAMSYDLKTISNRMKEKWIIILSAVGVLIFSGVGLICMILGSNFLDYSVLSQILPATDSVMARSHAMLGVEIGVALTVMCSMYGIYVNLSSDGRFDKGL